jgi:hypothetical protein
MFFQKRGFYYFIDDADQPFFDGPRQGKCDELTDTGFPQVLICVDLYIDPAGIDSPDISQFMRCIE